MATRQRRVADGKQIGGIASNMNLPRGEGKRRIFKRASNCQKPWVHNIPRCLQSSLTHFLQDSQNYLRCVPLSEQIVGLADRIDPGDVDAGQLAFRNEANLAKSVSCERLAELESNAGSGPVRASTCISPDLAKRWGKRFWQSCQGKADREPERPPRQDSRFYSVGIWTLFSSTRRCRHIGTRPGTCAPGSCSPSPLQVRFSGMPNSSSSEAEGFLSQRQPTAVPTVERPRRQEELHRENSRFFLRSPECVHPEPGCRPSSMGRMQTG